MPGAAIVHCTPCGKLARSTERVRTGNGNRCYLAMAHDDVREPNPQEAQRDGQSAISQGSPLKELHQEGDEKSDRPVGSPLATPELTDEEVSVLCDIERDGSAKSDKQAIVKGLVERGFIVSSEEPLTPVKLTLRAQQLLSKRGVGLNES
jgi:hypothetical protein